MAIAQIRNPSVVVIDISTRLTMVGFAGESRPRFLFPTLIGYPSTDAAADEEFKSRYYIGQDLLQSLPPRLVCPVKGGLIEDWSAIEAIYTHAFNLLGVTPSKVRVLVTENVHNPREYKERVTQMLFHDFGVSHLFHAQRSVLALIAIQKKSGIVIDFEPDYVSFIPVYEELAIPHAMQIDDPPTTTGLEVPFIAKQIYKLLEKVDSDIHSILCNNILLTGSSTTTANFDTFLLQELQKQNTSGKSFEIIAPPERLYLPWIGGSIFGNR